MKRTEDSLRDLRENVKCTNIQVIGLPEEEVKKKVSEKNFRNNNQKLPNMRKKIVSQGQEVQKVPYRINPRKTNQDTY